MTCTQCGQVVEVSDFTIHLLQDCEQKRKFKMCPKCKEAIMISTYDRYGSKVRG